jgi:MFS superfamily sulfate permease-like transporter
MLAVKDYVRADATPGYWLAGMAFVITLLLLGNRKYPPALFVILLGIVYALSFKLPLGSLVRSVGFSLPEVHVPSFQDISRGFVLLALPQIPLSLGNSILATRQGIEDFFPQRRVAVRKISLTYSLMNLVAPFLSGIPVCHGSGGMAGHYAFGARTGGSVLIQGALYVALGVLFGRGFDSVIHVFPLPILGVILLFEGLALLMLIRDCAPSKNELGTALLVGLIAVGLPYGYVIGLLVGLFLALLLRKREIKFGG